MKQSNQAVCWCGGYAVANCTQCGQPLCDRHAHNSYARSGSQLLTDFLAQLPDPIHFNIRVGVARKANEEMITSYRNRHVCLECHKENVDNEFLRRKALIQIPEDKFSFTVWLILDSGYQSESVGRNAGRRTSFSGSTVPQLENEEIIEGWLHFAQAHNVPPDKTISVVTETRTKRPDAAWLAKMLFGEYIVRKGQEELPAWLIHRTFCIHTPSGYDYEARYDYFSGYLAVEGIYGFEPPSLVADPFPLEGVLKRIAKARGLSQPPTHWVENFSPDQFNHWLSNDAPLAIWPSS